VPAHDTAAQRDHGVVAGADHRRRAGRRRLGGELQEIAPDLAADPLDRLGAAAQDQTNAGLLMALDLQAADQARDREAARRMLLVALDRHSRGRLALRARCEAADDEGEQAEQPLPARDALAHGSSPPGCIPICFGIETRVSFYPELQEMRIQPSMLQHRAIRSDIMRPRASAALLAVWACLAAEAAYGQATETGGVRISGRVENQTVVGGSANVATGVGSSASTAVGSIGRNVQIDGRLNVFVQTGPIANLASGTGQKAVTSVGSVHEGSRLAGQRQVVISTGQIINMTDRSGRPACVVVGSVGEVPGC